MRPSYYLLVVIAFAVIVKSQTYHVRNYSKSLESSMRFGILDSFLQGVNQIASVLSGVQDTISIVLNQAEDQINLDEPNEDAHLNIEQLVAKYGYPFEEHSVTTEDGYIINLHRIPHGRNNKTNTLTVFLMHGIIDSSDSWILQGPEKSLAYILADNGFDVWLGNARGNKHGLQHTTLDTNQSEFWEFTWEEIGLHDLPAMIDYTLNVTEKENIYYVGYSQGTTSFYVMSTLKPEYNVKVKLMFALAPVAWMANVRSPLVKMFSPASSLLGSILWDYNLSNTEFLGSMSETVCRILGISCSSLLYMLIGQDSRNMNEIMPVVLGHMPTTSSTLQLIHYGQLVKSRRFCRFDHGAQKNMEIYSTESPPDYNMSNITVHVVIYFRENDWLAVPKDVKVLLQNLPNVIDSNHIQDFNHLDFLYADKANEVIYAKIVSQILDFENIL